VNARGGLALLLGLLEVVEVESDFGERGVRLGERGVEFRGLLEGGLRAAQRLGGRAAAPLRALEVALAFEQFGVSLRAALARRRRVGLRLRRSVCAARRLLRGARARAVLPGLRARVR